MDPLARIKKAGARMMSQGNNLDEEWQTLIDIHGLESLLAALHRLAPKDRWPNKVRKQAELTNELPGLTDVTDKARVLEALGFDPEQFEDDSGSEHSTMRREMALAGVSNEY